MKIALSTTNDKVDGHFGHCEYFTTYTVNKEKKEILEKGRIEAPKGCGCSSNIASILKQEKVDLLLTNNLGGNILSNLKKEDIEVILGCSGDVQKITEDYLHGRLKINPFVCLDHK